MESVRNHLRVSDVKPTYIVLYIIIIYYYIILLYIYIGFTSRTLVV